MPVVAEKPPIATEEEPVRLRKPRRAREEDDIDITPMIDLVFLLLIFFLVSSTPDQLTSIDLPEATHGVAVSQLDAVIFTVGEGGLDGAPIYAADGRIPGTELPDAPETRRGRILEMVQAGLREDKTNVVIKGDKNVAHREIARLIKDVSQVSGMKIHLAVMDTH